MTFSDFNFEPSLLEGLTSMGYVKPTPIQEQTIPIILEGKDLIACAQTGTGKTASYLLPVIHKMSQLQDRHLHTLILSPTRELAQQIDQQVEGLAYFTGISSIAVYGGGDGMIYETQRKAIIEGADIMIATPGRLISFLISGVVKFEHLENLVLDEADRMLDMGFYDDILKIIGFLPASRQTMLFSATMPPRIRELAKKILKDPQQVNISISQPAAGIDQQAYMAHDEQKNRLLQSILAQGSYPSAIIFASTKEKVKTLSAWFKKMNMPAEAFSSDLEQEDRERILRAFKAKLLPVIIGTDVLSRGIDVEGISLVLNYDVPPDPEDYIHRIGRTARAETTGTAITFINDKDQRKFQQIEEMIGREIPKLPLPEELGEAPEYHPSSRRGSSSSRATQGGSKNKLSNGERKTAAPHKKRKVENNEESSSTAHHETGHADHDFENESGMESTAQIESDFNQDLSENSSSESDPSSEDAPARKPGRKGKSSARSRPPHKAGDPRPEPVVRTHVPKAPKSESNASDEAPDGARTKGTVKEQVAVKNKKHAAANQASPASKGNKASGSEKTNAVREVSSRSRAQGKESGKSSSEKESRRHEHIQKGNGATAGKKSAWDWLLFWKKK